VAQAGYVPERTMREKEALLPKKRIFGTNTPSKQGRSPTLTSKKVIVFTNGFVQFGK